MRRSVSARVINVSANWHVFSKIRLNNMNLHNGSYTAAKAHLQSKLALVLFTREMANRLGGPHSKVKTYAINPGIVNTRRVDNIVARFLKALIALSIEMGPQTYLYCALAQQLDNESGHYYE
ncbi:unnamed protein product [Oppiella nova]|uniref:Uncharacterized protein n=1 Tax=Oppiella nova TaxID=334625 RepID=A0A7R9MCT8_9ACAR|nr:unnamed protein product [Oppiella nova]CAG2174999.1 unnamed protein product [Oppiella nova]